MQSNLSSMVGTATPQSYALHREMSGLLTDMRLNRHPDTINNRIRNIQRQMSQVQYRGQALNTYGTGMAMHHGLSQMRNNVHSFYNFH